MKKIFVVLLSVLFVLSMAVAAFAVHPSQPSEMVKVGAKGKTQIVLGGSIRFRGDTRHDLPAFKNGVYNDPDAFGAPVGGTDYAPSWASSGSADVVDLLSNATDAQLAQYRASAGGSWHNVLANINNVLGFPDYTGVGGSDHRSETLLPDDRTDHTAAYDGRVRLWLEAFVSDSTRGKVQLETGLADNVDTWAWGCEDNVTVGSSVVGSISSSHPNDTSGTYPEGNCKKDELRVLEAYIVHEGSGLLGIPAGIKIGQFPIQLGRGLFLLHNRFGDDVINVYMDPSDMVHLEFATIKFTEGNAANADDDTDAYAVIGNITPSDVVGIGFDVTYLRDKDAFSKQGLDLWNYAARVDIDAGVNIYAEIDWQTGEAKDVQLGANPAGLLDDLDFSGYAVVLGVAASMPGPPALNLNAEFGRGSGDDDLNDADIETFQTSLSATKKFTYVYDYRVITAALGTNTGIANTTYVKLGASGQPSPDLTAGLDFYWLQASEDVMDEDDLGYEIDGKLSYKIDTNLEYFIEGGILFAGKFYDVLDKDEDAKDPWVVRHGIQLGF